VWFTRCIGSNEEIEDLRNAYTECNGSIEEIMSRIPHSTHEDEPRFITILSNLISSGQLPLLEIWESSIHDEKARLVRKKQGAKEANEAEELAKELGVWDEFYGSGKPSSKKGRKGKGKQKRDEEGEDGEDHSALQALMLKRKKNLDGFFDGLAEKYAEPEKKSGRGKKRGKDDSEEEEESTRKKPRTVPVAPDIDDEEFAKLQEKLFSKSKKTRQQKSKKKTKS
jgi:DnaJ family protein C protein 9